METKNKINNDFYNELGQKWYSAEDNPVALLRAENIKKFEWIHNKCTKIYGNKKLRILDIGCGAGFLTNEMAKLGHEVFGIDLSSESLNVAKSFDSTKTVKYITANAYQIPLESESFDLVFSMDFLEHVDQPELIVAEASRLLKTPGTFIYHTFNKNWISHLIVIKGIEWFVKNTPKNMHVIDLFIKPEHLRLFCQNYGMKVVDEIGLRPEFFNTAFLKMLFTGCVSKEFKFKFTNSLKISYMGCASKI